MSFYEYTVVPAPRSVPRARGAKRADDRLALSLTDLMNEFGAEGWEYQRSESLTVESRSGLLGRRSTSVETVLIFRRWVETDLDDAAPADRYPESVGLPAQPARAPVEGLRLGAALGERPYQARNEARQGRAEPVLRPLHGRDPR